jgi:hypothetical protein
MAQSSCSENKPFILLGNGATAPVLDYNLPQETCLDIDMEIPLFIPSEHFSEAAFAIPVNNIWSRIAGLSYEALLALLKEDILGSKFSLFFNGQLLTRVKDAIRFVNSTAYQQIVVKTEGEGIKLSSADVKALIRSNENISSAALERGQIVRKARISQDMFAENSEAIVKRTSPSVSTALALSTGAVQGGPKEPFYRKVRINHLTGIAMAPENQIQIAGLTLDYIVRQMMKGFIPEVYQDANGKIKIGFREKPASPKPKLILLEEHKLCSYLADYGAGKVVKTFSLLPGEKTEITVKSFKDYKSTYSKISIQSETDVTSTYYSDDEKSTSSLAENVLDSFSQSSVDEFQKQIEDRTQIDNSSSTSSNSTDKTEKKGDVRIRLKAGEKSYLETTGSVATTNVTGSTSNQSRQDMVSTLNSSLESHVQNSSKNREVEVNTTTGNERNQSKGGNSSSTSEMTTTTSEEISKTEQDEILTVRKLENINRSRVLNFVFRQMLQEYISILYLNDVRLVFSNGYKESIVQFKISSLQGFLDKFIIADKRAEVKKAILLHFCNVSDYQDIKHSFLEKVIEEYDDCDSGTPDATYTYYRKKSGLTQTYTTGSFEFTVPGIILSVTNHMLKTDSVLCDALLGQGEALDCYNNRLQEASADQAELKNERYELETARISEKMLAEINKVTTALNAINAIVDPIEQAQAFRDIFGECCMEDVKLLLGKVQNCIPPTVS